MEIAHHPLMSARPRRQHLQLTVAQMAGRLGVTATTYNRFERGERRTYTDQALIIANMLGCSVEDLGRPLTREEELELFQQGLARKHGTVVATAPVTTKPLPDSFESQEVADLIADWAAEDFSGDE